MQGYLFKAVRCDGWRRAFKVPQIPWLAAAASVDVLAAGGVPRAPSLGQIGITAGAVCSSRVARGTGQTSRSFGGTVVLK